MTYFAVAAYLVAIVAANLVIAEFGSALMPVVAFFLIGLDLALRDSLHDAWTDNLALKMGALIGSGSLITYLVHPEAGWVALASTAAFAGAMTADTGIYHWLRERPYQLRANASNTAGAAVDSVLFPTIAFGAILPWATLGQFAAKTAGGAVWVWIIEKARARWCAYVAAALLFFCAPTAAEGQDLYLTSHYDVARQQPIIGVVHDTPLPGKFFATGYVEVWRNPANGVPAGQWTVFSKHWITRPITDRLSVSLEMSFIYNRPGVNFQWPQKLTFFENGRGPYVTPKIGLQYQIY